MASLKRQSEIRDNRDSDYKGFEHFITGIFYSNINIKIIKDNLIILDTFNPYENFKDLERASVR